MATIKSYTDLEQSKKLAEILPLDSADMEYLTIKENGKLVGGVPFVKDDSEVEDSAYSHTYDRIACWSLAALLGVLPKEILCYKGFVYLEFHVWENSLEYINNADYTWQVTESCINPIDACYAMILKLNELKML